jgi:predicted RND superfamily exporter protein
MVAIAMIAFALIIIAWMLAPTAKSPAPAVAATLPFGSAAGVAD